MSSLSNYTSLLDWGINAHILEDTPTNISRKRALLAELNRHCGTNYSEQHLNSWYAGRKKTPEPVWRYLCWNLIECELGYDQPELAGELLRLMGLELPSDAVPAFQAAD